MFKPKVEDPSLLEIKNMIGNVSSRYFVVCCHERQDQMVKSKLMNKSQFIGPIRRVTDKKNIALIVIMNLTLKDGFVGRTFFIFLLLLQGGLL